MSLLLLLRRLVAVATAPTAYQYGVVTIGPRRAHLSTVGHITDPGSVLIDR